MLGWGPSSWLLILVLITGSLPSNYYFHHRLLPKRSNDNHEQEDRPLFLTIQSNNAILACMGRKRSFDDDEVLARAREVFLEHGYEGTSIDALVKATGLLRGSLYGAFGSKRGMFVAALHDATDSESRDSGVLNLVLVALMELSDHDLEVRGLVRDYLAKLSCSGSGDTNAVTVDVATLLGETLLQRAHVRFQSDNERSKS